MRDLPTGSALLALARDVLLNDLMPLLPPTAHLDKEALPTFMFIGRLAANKRPDHAIEAFRWIRRSLPEARLWVIGRGAMEPGLREAAPNVTVRPTASAAIVGAALLGLDELQAGPEAQARLRRELGAAFSRLEGVATVG